MNLRRVFGTWNNWEEDFKDKEEVKKYFDELPHLKFYVIGFEIGEENKTPHLQFVVGFTQQKTFNTLREYFKNNHLEKIIDLKSAVEYCKKTEDFIEFGDIDFQGKRSDLKEFIESIKDGYTDLELLESYPTQYIKYQSMIGNIREVSRYDKFKKEIRKLKVFYIAGETGVGKTRFIYDTYGFDEIYRVTDYKNPFDGYKGQDILVLDEFRSDMRLSQMLMLLDIYPYMLPSRYHDKVACFTKVFILSNIPIDMQYPHMRVEEPESVKAFERRIKYSTFVNSITIDLEIEKIKKMLNDNEEEMPF